MKITDVFVLADDVQMVATDTLAEDRRRLLHAQEGDFVVTRARDDSYAEVVDHQIADLVREFAHGATIVDAVLQYCRARFCDPEEMLERAFPMLEELIRAGVLAIAKLPEPPVRTFSHSERLIVHYTRRLDPAGALFETGLPEPPYTSINYGSGGVAYFLYRLACIRADAQLLSWAKLWIEKALQEIETKGKFAFADAVGEIRPEISGPVALYHSPTGLHAVRALIGHAANDHAAQKDGLAAFVNAAQPPCPNIDITLGTSGVLLGAALLGEAMPGQPG